MPELRLILDIDCDCCNQRPADAVQFFREYNLVQIQILVCQACAQAMVKKFEEVKGEQVP